MTGPDRDRAAARSRSGQAAGGELLRAAQTAGRALKRHGQDRPVSGPANAELLWPPRGHPGSCIGPIHACSQTRAVLVIKLYGHLVMTAGRCQPRNTKAHARRPLWLQPGSFGHTSRHGAGSAVRGRTGQTEPATNELLPSPETEGQDRTPGSDQPRPAGLDLAGELRDAIRKGEGLCSSPRAPDQRPGARRMGTVAGGGK
jgi:hypothetical protein